MGSEALTTIPSRVREAQRVFEQTGAHAAAVCGPDGEVLCVREDVGRHNAVDKVIGWAATERRLPLTGMVLFVSGRSSFEIVQKAAVAGMWPWSPPSAPPQPGRGAGRAGRHDPGRVPPRQHERLHPPASRHPPVPGRDGS